MATSEDDRLQHLEAQAEALAQTQAQLRWETNARKTAETLLQQRDDELSLLNQVSQAFISTLDLDHVLATVLEEVRQLLGVVACSAWLIDPETNELVCRQVTDPQGETVRGWRLAPDVGLVGWVAVQGKSLIVPDTWEEDRHFKGVDDQTGLSLRSILSAPLRVKSGVIGVLQVVDARVNRFNKADLALLESLAATVAIAVENGRLYEQARRDAETKAVLLREVNHRVKNNLAAIIGLLYAERRQDDAEDQVDYRAIMDNLVLRIQGLSTVHSMLSAAEWSPLPLDELAGQVIHSSLQLLPPDKYISVAVTPAVVQVVPKQANSLALVINELVTNTIKYALAEREQGSITVEISTAPDSDVNSQQIIFRFRDDGPGYPEPVLRAEAQNVGLYLVKRIVDKDLNGRLTFSNQDGAVTTIRFNSIS